MPRAPRGVVPRAKVHAERDREAAVNLTPLARLSGVPATSGELERPTGRSEVDDGGRGHMERDHSSAGLVSTARSSCRPADLRRCLEGESDSMSTNLTEGVMTPEPHPLTLVRDTLVAYPGAALPGMRRSALGISGDVPERRGPRLLSGPPPARAHQKPDAPGALGSPCRVPSPPARRRVSSARVHSRPAGVTTPAAKPQLASPASGHGSKLWKACRPPGMLWPSDVKTPPATERDTATRAIEPSSTSENPLPLPLPLRGDSGGLCGILAPGSGRAVERECLEITGSRVVGGAGIEPATPAL
jgi:hypothetical protein